jgi:dethiobiotin synthetase
VGKTWVTAEVARHLVGAGVRASARKPVQSFAPGEGALDAEVLAAASGEDPQAVCPPHRGYPVALAPPMAAEALGRPPFGVAELVGELAWPAGIDAGLVETVGGVRSPLAADGDSLALATALEPDLLVLVASPGLGAINAVRLSAAALRAVAAPLVVMLNRFDPGDDVNARNQAWLSGRDGFDVVTDPASVAARLAPPR